MRRRATAVLSFLAVAASPLAVLATAPAAEAAPTELFFSEYIEGSGVNKALEIYNGTATPVTLNAATPADAYSVQMFFNGSATAGLTINLTGTVAAGDVFVLGQTAATLPEILAADQLSSAGWYNGDDAVVLRKGSTVLDVIGQIGNDPGTEWGTGATSTQDNTLRRLSSIQAGDTDGSNTFDPSVEWEGFALDTVSDLGIPPGGDEEPATPVINEFSASTTGTDVEYVEVHDAPSTDLSAYKVLEIEGDTGGTATGVVDEVISLGATDADGLYLASLPANALENGTLTLLLVKGFTGAPTNDLDTDDDGTLDSTPWTALVDAVAVNDGGAGDRTYGTPSLGVAYDGLAFAPGGASRIPDGTDTDAAADWMRNDYDLAGIPGFTGTPTEGEALNTPGDPNAAYEPPVVVDTCESAITPIHDVQGNGAASPLDGQSVLTEGVVVGRFQSGTRDAIYIQTPVVDADPNTSEGVYVFADAAGFANGQTVRVRGTVDEFDGLTEITAVSNIFRCGEGTTTIEPTTLSLPIDAPGDLEKYEGMLVTFPQDLVIAEYFNYAQFGEVSLTANRQDTPTAVVEPGQSAIDLAAEQALARVLLDDGRSASNPSPPRHPDGAQFTLQHSFRGGDLLSGVTGVMDYQFDEYRIQPTTGATYTSANERPSVPDVGGSLTVSSFNVLNYFSTLNSRGANTEAELVRQEDKIVAALAEIDADVFGLLEIENNEAAPERLVGALNEKVGAGTYDYISTGTIGTDVIKVALIYKPGTVTPVGAHKILDETVDGRFDTSRNRPAVAQTFRENGTDEVVTVAVNHLKSKGSACTGDPDTGDGSGNCDETRTQAAAALVDWMASDPTGSGSPKNLIIGDLNSYDHEDPIDTFVAGGYTDLVKKFGGESAYSYVFDGKIGYLDHGLASAPLVDEVTGTKAWHINADEPSILDYDMTYKAPAEDALYAPDPFRSSDHDPVIIGLALDSVAPEFDITLSKDVLFPPNHKYVTVTADVEVTDPSGVASWDLVSVTSNEPDEAPGKADGNTVNDIVIVNDTTFKLRAERNELGSGRVYTITYEATDNAGNTGTATATVRVPISR
ncbi:ExeM/NucH family extracellular endonuclease [Nocardioides bigeumensis]|uniref:ExeM/NucH family extracellular endonuclease n=1 Tax=Nocardioides bigeumensis TaxID=433657 RepID=A0ABN2Y7R2_9ACTN